MRYDMKDTSRDNFRQRERSSSGDKYTGRMSRGVNCAADYNPRLNKQCGKCVSLGAHHEYECPIY